MTDISNRLLALLVLFAIGLTVLSSVTMLNRLSAIQRPAEKITGRAQSSQANVTLTVESSLSIMLRNDTINFGIGYVNDSCVAGANNATLYAGATYNDTEGLDCWTANETLYSPTSLHIENDGNRNLSVTVKGPTPIAFFNNTGERPAELMFRVRNYQGSACPTSATMQSDFMNFTGGLDNVCTDFQYTPSDNDEIAIDVKVIIPAKILPGTYENSTIEFTGNQV
jgi:hypothetical protein